MRLFWDWRHEPAAERDCSAAENTSMNSFVFKLVGFVIGAVLGLGLCWLVFSFEFSGGPNTSSGVSIRAFGMSLFTTYGILVDFVPAAVYVLLSGLPWRRESS
jgi:hypothetical protein